MSPRRCATLHDAQKMAALAFGGLLPPDIAHAVGFSVTTVRRCLRRLEAGDDFSGQAGIDPDAIRRPSSGPDERHVAAILNRRPQGFPVAFSRAHFRRAA